MGSATLQARSCGNTCPGEVGCDIRRHGHQPMNLSSHARVRCFLRCVVHACYREIRHVGPSGDWDARLEIGDGPFVDRVAGLQQNRNLLQKTTLFTKSEGAATAGAVLKPYVDLTQLTLPDLATLFDEPGWQHKYGGKRWAAIVKQAEKLVAAVDAGNWTAAQTVCDEIAQSSHNSGKLGTVATRLEGEFMAAGKVAAAL